MSLQHFFTRSTFGRFALFMMAGLLCASLSARPLLAAPDKDAPAAVSYTHLHWVTMLFARRGPSSSHSRK